MTTRLLLDTSTEDHEFSSQDIQQSWVSMAIYFDPKDGGLVYMAISRHRTGERRVLKNL